MSRETYRVDATVLMPLLVVSVPLAGRDDVGHASVVVTDEAAGDGTRLRTFEFFAASRPARARQLDRLGFLREATRLGSAGARWTAQFGVVSATREATRDEAEERLDRPETVQTYTVLDGFIETHQASSTTARLDLENGWSDAAALYEDLLPRWAATEPDEHERLGNDSRQRYPAPVGFLGALDHSLRVAAVEASGGSSPHSYRYTFVHGDDVYHLDLEDHDLDDGRTERYRRAGALEGESVLHRLSYRILDERGSSRQTFRVWIEMPPPGTVGSTAPILPVAMEFKARSFLKLEIVRLPEPPASGPS